MPDAMKKVKALIQLDIDAVHAYEQAIDKITIPSVKEQLSQFKEDHQRHIRELSEKLRSLGQEPPKEAPDLKGYLIEGFTALRSMTGNEGALKAMKTNEHTTNKKYDEGRKLDVQQDLKEMLERNYQDERRHLDYVEQTLKDRLWEK